MTFCKINLYLKNIYLNFRNEDEEHNPSFKTRMRESVLASFYEDAAGIYCMEVACSSEQLNIMESHYKEVFKDSGGIEKIEIELERER